MTQRIIAFGAQKGGVGKTTTVVNVAAGLARRGRKVCVCDLDPQANTTKHFGFKPQEFNQSTYDLILKGAALKDLAVEVKENLTLVPSKSELAGAEVDLLNLPGKDGRLKKALIPAKEYDYIILDLAPSLGQLVLNGLTAAKEIIVPVQAHFHSYESLADLIKTIKMVQEYTNSDLEIGGFLVTFFNKQINLSKMIYDLLQENFADKVFKTKINSNIKLAEAAAAGKDIFSYYSNCQGAWDYAALCDEITAMEVRP